MCVCSHLHTDVCACVCTYHVFDGYRYLCVSVALCLALSISLADGAAVARRAALRTRCGSREMLASPSDLFVDGGIGEVQSLCYVIHSHFGGEDYASQLRVELMAPPAVVPLLEWCRAAPRRFTARQAWRGARHNGAPDLTFPLAAETLLALERNGFCRRARKALR